MIIIKLHQKLFTLLLTITGLLSISYYILIIYKFKQINFIGFFLLFGIALLIISLLRTILKRSLTSFLFKPLAYFINVMIAIFITTFCITQVYIIDTMQDTNYYETNHVLVLGAGLINDQMTSALVERLDTTLEYLETYPNTKVIVSGGIGSYSTIAESTAMKEYLIENGINSDQIIEDPYSANTLENITNSLPYFNNNEVISIVTSDFHVARAIKIANDLGLNAQGISAKSNEWLLPNYLVREYFAYIKLYMTTTFLD